MEPHGGEDEEELDEHRTERQHPAHQAGEHRIHVPGLVGDLARDFVGAHRVLGGRLLVAKVGADEHKGHGDAEPQEAEGKEGAEGHGTRGLLAPDEDVEAEEDAEAHACSGGHQRAHHVLRHLTPKHTHARRK
eukprot:1156138-Pelagomonas_calceolata.AAC.21